MKILRKIKLKYRSKYFTIYPLAIILGILLGYFTYDLNLGLRKVFKTRVAENVHIKVKPNWIQFHTDKNKINKEIPSIPTRAFSGMYGIANGRFHSLCFIDTLKMDVDSIYEFNYYRSEEINIEQIANSNASIRIQNSEKEYITPVIFSFWDKNGLYTRSIPIKDFSNPRPKNKSKVNKPNANFIFECPSDILVTVKFINSSLINCTDKRIPVDFFIDNPIINSASLYNQGLVTDSCITTVIEFNENDSVKLAIGADKMGTIVNGGIIEVDTSIFRGEYMFGSKNNIDIKQFNISKNNNKPFDIGIELESNNEGDAYYNIISSANYVFFTSPKGNISVAEKHFEITDVDKVLMYGDFHLALSKKNRDLAGLTLEGVAHSIKINNKEILLTRWEQIDSGIRGGLIGGILGFILSLITMLIKRLFDTNIDTLKIQKPVS